MTKKRKPKSNSIKNIISGIALLAVAVFCVWLIAQKPTGLTTSILDNFRLLKDSPMGILGAILYLCMGALCGNGMWLIPMLLGFTALCLLFFLRPGNIQKVGICVLTLGILSFLHLNVSYISFMDNLLLGLAGCGGGVPGALLSFVVLAALGPVGARILLVVVLLVSLVLIGHKIVKQRNGLWIQDVKESAVTIKDMLLGFIFVDEEAEAQRKARKAEKKLAKQEREAQKGVQADAKISEKTGKKVTKDTSIIEQVSFGSDSASDKDTPSAKVTTSKINEDENKSANGSKKRFFAGYWAKKQAEKAVTEAKTISPAAKASVKEYVVIPKEKQTIMRSMSDIHRAMDAAPVRTGYSPKTTGTTHTSAAASKKKSYSIQNSVDDFQKLLEKRNVSSTFSDAEPDELSIVDRWNLAGIERNAAASAIDEQNAILTASGTNTEIAVETVAEVTADADVMRRQDDLQIKEEEDAELDAMLAADAARQRSSVIGFSKSDGGNPKTITAATAKTKNRSTSVISDIPSARGISFQKSQAEQDKADVPIQKTVVEGYQLPAVDLLDPVKKASNGASWEDTKANIARLEQTLQDFGVKGKIVNVSVGPAITQYEFQPAAGVKVSKITNLADDIALSMAVADVRMEAPIPGKAAIGIELPNKARTTVGLRELIESDAFRNSKSKTTIALGKDISGNAVVADLAKMPHLLIAGSTGSGKSVCMNTLINSILYKAKPNEVKFLMVDPKKVELTNYNGIPHLITPVVTDPKKAASALRWAVREMDRRYDVFANAGVKDMVRYNRLCEEKLAMAVSEEEKNRWEPMPYIVVLIDELADLMMVAPTDVEDAICRLAQLARAAGIHLVVATQRPSVDVITGIIKANMPSRIAFAVSSQVDSRTILDMGGAEKLLGYGDMLFYPTGMPKPQRLQGVFVSDGEIDRITEAVKGQDSPVYNEDITTIGETSELLEDSQEEAEEWDSLLGEATKLFIENGQASISLLQRRFRIGYTRAARIVDQLEQRGFIGSYEGSKPRQIKISLSEYEALVANGEL